MNEGIRLRREKATALGVRYREVDLDRNLWGEWRLARAWGRRGTRLGQVRVAPCGSRDEGLARIAAILKRRRQRRYDLVVGTGADSDTLAPVRTGDNRNGRASDPATTDCILI